MITKSFYKKFIILVFIGLILFSIAPKTASAAVPTFEMNPLMTGQLPEMTFEWAFKIATEILKREILNMLVDQIVAWIQGGGTPKFITDWPGFLQDVVDQAGGKFIQQIGLSQLCSPFKLLLSAAFIPIPTFSERTSCTLSKIGVNIDNFLKDFNNGGWIAWQEMVLKPQNNIYGAYLLTWDEYNMETSAAAKAAAANAQAGKGFLSVKNCIASHTETDYLTGETITICDQYEIVTPGAVVGDLVSRGVASDIDYIVNSQDLEAYIAAITDAVLNRLFAEGIGLLHMALSSSGDYKNGSPEEQCKGLLGTSAYNDCLAAIQAGKDILEFQKSYAISIIEQDLAYQNQLLAAKQATLGVLNQSIDILNQLKNCQGSEPPELAQVQSAAADITSQITQIQSDIIALQALEEQIRALTDITQMPSFWTQVMGINPTLTYNLVVAAQQETIQKQTDLANYQQQLTNCQQ